MIERQKQNIRVVRFTAILIIALLIMSLVSNDVFAETTPPKRVIGISFIKSDITVNVGEEYTAACVVNSEDDAMSGKDVIDDITASAKDGKISLKSTKLTALSNLEGSKLTGAFTITFTAVSEGTTSLTLKASSGTSAVLTVNVTKKAAGATANDMKDIGTASDEQQDDVLDSVVDAALDMVNWVTGFTGIEAEIKNSGSDMTLFKKSTQDNVVKTLNGVFLPIAYAIALIAWSIGMGKNSISLDLYDTKKFIKHGVRLIVSLILITAISQIFVLMRKIEISMISNVLDAAGADIDLTINTEYDFSDCKSDLWIIGPIITFVKVWMKMPKIVLVSVINIIAYIILQVTLIFRSIKICIFQGVAPVFAGLVSSEEGEKYTNYFIINYLKLLAQGIAMAIVFYIYKKIFWTSGIDTVLSDTGTIYSNGGTLSNNFTTLLLVEILLPFLMLKTDKIIDKMIGKA